MSQKRKNSTMKSPKWQPEVPHNDRSLLPPPGVDLDTKTVLKKCITARAALAELKQAAEMMPNQAILINTLPLLEAQASSEIENIVTTNDRLFQYQNAETSADPATKEALRYRHALLLGYEDLAKRPLTTNTAEIICTTIKGVNMGVRKAPGTTLKNSNGKVIYTPPVGEDLLRNLLANWERFLNEDTELDPLIRMAVGHYQFEAIHPFTDGNGRTGRILNSLFLIQEQLLTVPILYLSRYIIQTKSDYYRLLLDVTSNNSWERWINYMLVGVEETATWTVMRVKAVQQLLEHTIEYVRAKCPKIYSYELVNQIFEQPYCRIQNIVDRENVGRQAASRYLKELVDIGVLNEMKVGRDKLFIHPKFLQLLIEEPNTFEPYS